MNSIAITHPFLEGFPNRMAPLLQFRGSQGPRLFAQYDD